MMTAILAGAIGVLIGAALAKLVYREELEERRAWERQAREVLRPLVTWQYRERLLPTYVAKVRRLLGDEAGA